MTRNQLERRYLDFGLNDFKLKTVDDLLNVHGIDYMAVDGYAGLDDLNRVIYKKFIVKFFNVFGLDNRAVLTPRGIYWVEDRDYVVVEDDGNRVLSGGVVYSIDKTGVKRVLDEWDDDEYNHLSRLVDDPTFYLRFEYMQGERKEWLHVIKKGEDWY
jgi:hypothetical protein